MTAGNSRAIQRSQRLECRLLRTGPMGQFGLAQRGADGSPEAAGAGTGTPGKRTLTERLSPVAGAGPEDRPMPPPGVEDEPPPIVGNPLSGLQLGDGRAKFRTQLKGCVQQLKDKLIEKLGAPLLEREHIVLDRNSGVFDEATLRAVHLFETEHHLKQSGNKLEEFTAKELWFGDKQPPRLDPARAGSGAELAGLRPGDGVQPPRNTEDFKRRVRLLQDKLRERVPAPQLEINGELLLANDTLLTYHKFQQQIGETPDNGKVSARAADLLMSGARPENGKVDPPRPPKEKRHLTGIVGLRPGDGTGDNQHLKPYVRRLNELLDKKLSSRIQPADEFGPETLQVLHDFQARYNKAAGQRDEVRDSDAKLLEGGDQPQPSTFNPALEDRLNQIWNAYQFTLMARRDGLVKLGNDLKAVSDKKETIGGLLTAKGGDMATDALKDLVTKGTDAIVQHQIQARRGMKVEDYDNADITNTLVTMVFGGLAAGLAGGVAAQATWFALKALWGALFASDPDKLPFASEVDAFVQAAIDGTTRQEYGAQKDFLGSRDGKPKYRAKEAEQPGAGLAEAGKTLDTLEGSMGIAGEVAYNKGLDGWLVASARKDLKTVPLKTDDPEQHKETNIFHSESDLRDAHGVLQIHIKGEGPGDWLRVATRKAEINGLSKAARTALEARKLDDMAIPYVATGKVHYVDFRNQDVVDFDIFLARNEAGSVHWKNTEEVRRWLGEKRQITTSGTDRSIEGGARQALSEIGDSVFTIENIG